MKKDDKGLFEMDHTWKQKRSQAAAGQYDNICGLVIMKAAHVIYREAFHGYHMGVLIHVASLTKSILSALTGIAIEQGYIFPVSFRLHLIKRNKTKGGAVNTIPQSPGRSRTIVKNMSQVGISLPAADLGADHAMAGIPVFLYRAGLHWF